MKHATVLLALLLAACGGDGTTPPPAFEPTLLDEFVADRTGYDYDVLWTGEESSVDIHVLDVTSQTWRTTEEVDRTEWWHDVVLAMPRSIGTNPATVLVSGGSNGDPIAPGSPDIEYLALVASLTGRPAISIGQIPNQPLTVAGQGGPRSEDDLVAATWDRAIATDDPTWSAYFAMTRAVVRCLDAVQDYAATIGRPIGTFLVTGFSKRGATTWLVAAVDPRVVAIAPGVFDFLNFRPQARHHLDAYGGPAPALAPYAAYDLLDEIDDPAGDAVVAHSDPYAYRERFTMPKLLVASTGDQFFLPDAARFYLTDLPGETLLRYVPNTDHGLAPPGGDQTDVLLGVAAWQVRIRDGIARPRLAWSRDGDRLTLTTQPAATAVTLWTATNPAARDFRLEAVGAIWEDSDLAPQNSGAFVVTVPPPAEGWTAFFLEATFGSQTYSTQVYVTPDTYPDR